MKKRAQIPDARTYTTLFRGFGWNIATKNREKLLAETLHIYHSMFADNSPVKPNIMHTNAVLKVCAFAGNMDALYGVASKLPARGNGAADTLTYYTILNAIRMSLNDSTRGGNEKTKAEVVRQGMKIWEEVRERWSSGDLLMSEDLICAMGRLLLLNGEQGADNVLSLVEQTMGVPRQVSMLGAPARYGVKNHKRLLDEDVQDGSSQPTTPPSSGDATLSNDLQPPSKSLFAPIPKLSKSSLVQPSRNTLSLVIEACIAMQVTSPAQAYWSLLTDPSSSERPNNYDVLPDIANYHSYLRLLRLQRASGLALSLVTEMQANTLPLFQSSETHTHHLAPQSKSETTTNLLSAKVFRIALSACVRDNKNPNAFNYATTILRIMNATLEDADARSLSSYFDVVTKCSASRDSPALLLEAKDTAISAWRNLRSLLNYAEPLPSSPSPSSPSSPPKPPRYDSQDAAADDGWARQTAARNSTRENVRAEVLEAGTRFLTIYSRILDIGREKLDREQLKRVGGERGSLNAFVQILRRGVKGRRKASDREGGKEEGRLVSRIKFREGGVKMEYKTPSRREDGDFVKSEVWSWKPEMGENRRGREVMKGS